MNHPHNVLVVDDHPETLEAAEDVCLNLGFRAIRAGTQEEALRALELHRVCACLLDLELPGRQNSIARIEVGWGTLDRIQKIYTREELPVIMMTAHGNDHRHPARATLEEAAAFVKKPFGLPGDPPLEEVLKRVLAKTCEKRFPERCPHYETPEKTPRKKGKNGASRIYRGADVQLHLDGRKKDRRCRIEVNQQEKWVRKTTFDAYYFLGVALRTDLTETLDAKKVLGGDYNHAISRAKKDMFEAAGLDPAIVENDGECGYRLSIPPENVTCDPNAVKTFHGAIYSKRPWA